jgi:hypothetical protein
MGLDTAAGGLLTASIASISILTFVYIELARRLKKWKEDGEWEDNPWNIPEYKAGKFLKWSIYLGAIASLASLSSLYFFLDIQPAADFSLDTTLAVIAGSIVIVEVSAIVAGIKYFDDIL